jgi:hypothetical protein
MFTHRKTQTVSPKRKTPKLIAGFAALAATAIVATSGFAAAATNNKPSKNDCQKAGYTNYGMCLQDWKNKQSGAATGNQHSTGYGGNTSVATNVDLTLNNSNHNIIQVIVNIFR